MNAIADAIPGEAGAKMEMPATPAEGVGGVPEGTLRWVRSANLTRPPSIMAATASQPCRSPLAGRALPPILRAVIRRNHGP